MSRLSKKYTTLVLMETSTFAFDGRSHKDLISNVEELLIDYERELSEQRVTMKKLYNLKNMSNE